GPATSPDLAGPRSRPARRTRIAGSPGRASHLCGWPGPPPTPPGHPHPSADRWRSSSAIPQVTGMAEDRAAELLPGARLTYTQLPQMTLTLGTRKPGLSWEDKSAHGRAACN